MAGGLFNAQGSGQSKRDKLFGGRKDIESGEAGERSAEAKLDKADEYQDKTEDAYKVRNSAFSPCFAFCFLLFFFFFFFCFCTDVLYSVQEFKCSRREAAWACKSMSVQSASTGAGC